MQNLTGDEAAFYMDQQGAWIGLISEDVDAKYVEEKEIACADQHAALYKGIILKNNILCKLMMSLSMIQGPLMTLTTNSMSVSTVLDMTEEL